MIAGKVAHELIELRAMLDAQKLSGKSPVSISDTEHLAHRFPFLIIRHRDRNPAVLAAFISASISAMRSVSMRFVAARAECPAGSEIIDYCGREIVQRRLVLRHIDVLALAGAPLVVERRDEG